MTDETVGPLIALGWREWLSLPDLCLDTLRAKIDTGARSSALHVETMEQFRRDDQDWVRFSVRNDHQTGRLLVAEARVTDRRLVTDSGGHGSERLFIQTRMSLAGVTVPIEINLTDRRNMLFPMLLGRTALGGRFLVDPARSFVRGEPSPVSVGAGR